MNEKEAVLAKYRRRILPVIALFVAFFIAVVWRSYDLQIRGNTRLNNLTQSQYKTRLVNQPKRGTIYDRNGEILAMDIRVSSIGIHPHRVTDSDRLIKSLSEIAGVPATETKSKIASDKKFEFIRRRIPKSQGERLEELKLDGVQITDEYRRYYPHQRLAGQLLGSVGYDAKALGGIELTYDPYLRSHKTTSSVEKDARGRVITPLIKPDTNYDIFLTIDRNIQFLSDETLAENAVKHRAKSGFAIVMDVATGEVLAMSNFPRFDPNQYWKFDPQLWKNRALIDTFEPGSTFKTILMAAALDSGKVKSSDKFFCENGAYRIGKHIIHDHDSFGWLDAKAVLKKSSNIGIIKVALKTGQKEFYDFIKGLGFGEKSGIGFLGEAAGLVRHHKEWQTIEFSNIAFGQGLTVTGIQMAQAYAAFANGGVRMRPLLVSRIVDSGGQVVVENRAEEIARVMEAAQATVLSQMLHSVTQTGGTAPAAHIAGYLAAGKTGTAQKVNAKTHTYESGSYVSSFIGFAPAERPRVMVYVVYDTSSASDYYGGVVAAPVFKTIAEKTLAYLGEAPTHPVGGLAKASELKAEALDKPGVKTQTAVTNPTPQRSGGAGSMSPEGTNNQWVQNAVTNPLPLDIRAHQRELEKKVAATLKSYTVPDLRGLSLRKVLQMTQGINVDVQFQGSGVVIRQIPAPGTTLKKGQIWQIELANQS